NRSASAISLASRSRKASQSYICWLLSATAMPKTRPSQGASKTSSPFLRGTARSSLKSSMHWSLIARAPLTVGDSGNVRRTDERYADHGVARDERGQLILAQVLGAGRTLGQH